MEVRMRNVSPSKRTNSPRAMSVSPPPPDSIPSLTLDEIIASNRRTAAAARRTHYANTYKTHRRGKTPYLRHTPSSPLPPPGPSRPRGTPGHHDNRHWHHPYSRPKKLLSKAGKLLDCSVHYDANGDSKGSALIEFANERGAINAMANLQGAMLYGMPIVLDILVQ